jgi:predicted PurR-regulated permease PerM
MPLFAHRQQRAQLLIALLGLGIAIALWPYVTGLLAGPVLYVVFEPAHRVLRRWLSPATAASIAVVTAAFLILVPGVSTAGLVVNQAQQMAGRLVQMPLVSDLSSLRLGDIELGPRLVALGESAVSWIGSSAFGLFGTATRLALNLTIALFGLFFLLVNRDHTWPAIGPYIPFNAPNTARLRDRFVAVTYSTLIGTGLIALVQGVMVGAAFAVVGLPSAFFWGVITAVFAILPVVGSGLVWGPGAIALALGGEWGKAIGILIWGLVVVSSVDNVLRPVVYNRWARIHPLVTLVGALGGIRFFGILGLLIGPLALSYFFELIQMYRDEYIQREDEVEQVEGLVHAADVRRASQGVQVSPRPPASP